MHCLIVPAQSGFIYENGDGCDRALQVNTQYIYIADRHTDAPLEEFAYDKRTSSRCSLSMYSSLRSISMYITFRLHYSNINICEHPKVKRSMIDVDPPGP